MNKVLVFVESNQGKAKKSSLEVIHAFSAQGCEVDAVCFDPQASSMAADVGAQGAKKLFTVSNDSFKNYQSDTFAPALVDLFKKNAYGVMAGAATSCGKDLFPTLAAKLDAGLASDCVEIDAKAAQIRIKRPMLAGKYFVWAKFKAGPAVLTIRPNVLALGSGGAAAATEAFEHTPAARAVTTAVEGASGGAKADLSEADRIVSGGRAMKNADNFKVLNEMADVIGATVGASRAAVDSGYAPHSMQVGQTGKTVNPTLYIACGISGAIQHLAGMKTSKYIVAINTDPEAPIFQKADYGLVGDLFEVVPKLTEEFKKLLAQG